MSLWVWQSKRRCTQYDDRGSRGDYNARAQGSKCAEPDGTSNIAAVFNRHRRWNQGWQREGHGFRRSGGGSLRLEYRKRVARRRDACRRYSDGDVIELDTFSGAGGRED